MGIPSDRRFLRAARRQLGHLFPIASEPGCSAQAPCPARRDARVARRRLRRALVRARRRPALARLHTVECGRSLETTRRSRLAEICGYGYSRSHSRYFWGMRLHLACAPDGTPRAAALVAADRGEREVALKILPRALRGGETIVCDKGYAGHEFASTLAALGASVVRPARRNEPAHGVHLRPSVSASSRSFTPARTCSRSSATARAPHATCSRESRPACSPSPPASASTTSSAVPAARSSTTPRSRVASAA